MYAVPHIQGQGPLYVKTLDGVASLRNNEWANITFQNEFCFKGVLIFELDLMQLPRPDIHVLGHKIMRLLVVGETKPTDGSQPLLVTYRHIDSIRCNTYRGAPTYFSPYTGPGTRLLNLQNVRWCDGLRTLTREAETKCHLKRRHNLIKSIGRYLHDPVSWDRIHWDDVKRCINQETDMLLGPGESEPFEGPIKPPSDSYLRAWRNLFGWSEPLPLDLSQPHPPFLDQPSQTRQSKHTSTNYGH